MFQINFSSVILGILCMNNRWGKSKCYISFRWYRCSVWKICLDLFSKSLILINSLMCAIPWRLSSAAVTELTRFSNFLKSILKVSPGRPFFRCCKSYIISGFSISIAYWTLASISDEVISAEASSVRPQNIARIWCDFAWSSVSACCFLTVKYCTHSTSMVNRVLRFDFL